MIFYVTYKTEIPLCGPDSRVTRIMPAIDRETAVLTFSLLGM